MKEWKISRHELEGRLLSPGSANKIRERLAAIHECHGPIPDVLALDEALAFLEHFATMGTFGVRARFLRAELILDSVRAREDD